MNVLKLNLSCNTRLGCHGFRVLAESAAKLGIERLILSGCDISNEKMLAFDKGLETEVIYVFHFF